MAREELILKATGLATYADLLSKVPEGSLKTARNVVIDKDGLISPRRGYEKLEGTDSLGVISSMHTFADKVLIHRDESGNTVPNKLSYYTGSGWTDISADILAPSDVNRIRSIQFSKNIYFTSSGGVQKLDSISGDLIDAGAPQALNVTAVVNGTTPGSAIPAATGTSNNVAYRIVWGYKDANDNLILGAPSQREIFRNTDTGNTVDVDLTINIPSGITTAWFYQVYRSDALQDSPPSDELRLAYEGNPDGTDISNGFVTVTDIQPEELLGADLYTNATQEGILKSNNEPPKCRDMAIYQNHAFYANTESKYQIEIQLLGTGSNALQADDTITINGMTYTAKASPATATEFQIFTGGSPADDVEDTARALIDTVNSDPSNTTIDAVYSSDTSSISTDLPGKIQFIENDFGAAASFVVSATGTNLDTTWTPDLSGSGQTATNERRENRVYYSKFQQPEAVPVLNFFDVGAANDKILRILPLRESLMIFTEAGIYRLFGTTESSFQVVLLDNTTRLLAADTAVTLNNQVYGLFDQGIGAVSGSVNIISRVIEGQILNIRGLIGDDIDKSFGISYESDRKYIIFLQSAAGLPSPDIAYVFNTITNAWTTYDLAKSTGIVDPTDDKLYLANTNMVSVERKNFNETDIVDEQIDTTVSAVNGAVITIDSAAVAEARVGDIFWQDSGTFAKIIAVDVPNDQITVRDDLGFTVKDSLILQYFEVEIEWNPITCDHPSLLKQFSEGTMLTNAPMEDFELSFGGLTNSGFDPITFTSASLGNWGFDGWGEAPWGGDVSFTRYRTYIPRTKQRDSAILIKIEQNTAYNDFEVSGFSLYYRNIGPRSER